jgi:hypothetical protein
MKIVQQTIASLGSPVWIESLERTYGSATIVPPFADSNLPRRRCSAPVNAPLSWPKSSEATSDEGWPHSSHE